MKQCVECHSPNIKKDKTRCETYCLDCGLIHQASINYNNGNRIDLPWGIYR